MFRAIYELTAARWQWSVVDSPILFNCKSNHVHEEDLEHIIRDEDVDLSKVSSFLWLARAGGS
jgi:hypothetical protein